MTHAVDEVGGKVRGRFVQNLHLDLFALCGHSGSAAAPLEPSQCVIRLRDLDGFGRCREESLDC